MTPISFIEPFSVMAFPEQYFAADISSFLDIVFFIDGPLFARYLLHWRQRFCLRVNIDDTDY